MLKNAEKAEKADAHADATLNCRCEQESMDGFTNENVELSRTVGGVPVALFLVPTA